MRYAASEAGAPGGQLRGRLQRTDLDVSPIVPGRRGCEPLGRCQCSSGLLRLGELDVDDAQGRLRRRQPWIQAERLIERPCGFDPDVGMQVGESLVVEALCVGGRRADPSWTVPMPVRKVVGRSRSVWPALVLRQAGYAGHEAEKERHAGVPERHAPIVSRQKAKGTWKLASFQ